jgi:hypothetical protein
MLDRKRLARIKKACIEANGKEGVAIETVLKAVSAGVPDATGEEISAATRSLPSRLSLRRGCLSN